MSIFAGLMLFWLLGLPPMVVGLAFLAASRRERVGNSRERRLRGSVLRPGGR